MRTTAIIQSQNIDPSFETLRVISVAREEEEEEGGKEWVLGICSVNRCNDGESWSIGRW
jgi:hypothetical protein